MTEYQRAKPKRKIKVPPLLALSLATLVLASMLVLLAISNAALKRDNAALWAAISAMKGDNDARRSEVERLESQLESIRKMQEVTPGPPAARFTVESFEITFTSDKDTKFQTYTGRGTLRTGDAKDSFLALMKKTLKSGGAPTTQKVEYLPILVVGGVGTFVTDDFSEGKMEKPVYEFEVVGYVRLAAGGT